MKKALTLLFMLTLMLSFSILANASEETFSISVDVKESGANKYTATFTIDNITSANGFCALTVPVEYDINSLSADISQAADSTVEFVHDVIFPDIWSGENEIMQFVSGEGKLTVILLNDATLEKPLTENRSLSFMIDFTVKASAENSFVKVADTGLIANDNITLEDIPGTGDTATFFAAYSGSGNSTSQKTDGNPGLVPIIIITSGIIIAVIIAVTVIMIKRGKHNH